MTECIIMSPIFSAQYLLPIAIIFILDSTSLLIKSISCRYILSSLLLYVTGPDGIRIQRLKKEDLTLFQTKQILGAHGFKYEVFSAIPK